MEIGKKLKTARVKSGLTQEKVSEEIQVSRQTISNWENEKSYPDIVSVIKLSDLCNCCFIG
nr:helix-turn-helix transcriptional regulator [uncultured Bacillus sp.]